MNFAKSSYNSITDINITDELSKLIEIISQKSCIFRHIDSSRILVCISSNRSNGRSGTYGKLVPLKFENGDSVQKYNGKYYTIPRIINNGIEQLYIIYFYMPKFFDLPDIEKLRVIFHELYHISEIFNGDIRRMGNSKIQHGYSKKKFNSFFDKELIDFHDFILTTSFIDFLRMDSSFLRREFGKIYCRRMKIPKPVILEVN